MSDHTDRMDDAIQNALGSRLGSLAIIARDRYPSLTATGYLKVCPFCNDKGQKFCIKKSPGGGHWYWGCHNPSCQVSFANLKAQSNGDTIGFIAIHDGISRSAAVDKLLSITGTPNPREELPARKTPAKKKASLPPVFAPEPEPEPKPAPEPEPAPTAAAVEEPAAEIDTPEEPELFAPAETLSPPPPPSNVVLFGKDEIDGNSQDPPPESTVWDDIWQRLTLNAGDREELKRKRGYSSATIEKLGFRSSGKNNRALLQPVIAAWKEELLLSEGIVTRDFKTGELKLNAQLCGYGLKKRAESKDTEDEWGWTDPILIPYFDRHGRVIGIRPHKGGLSGKRYMREQGYELGFRNKRTRVKPYFNPLIWDLPDEWQGKCVLTEGEFKAGALYQTGIPAAAVPGIQMPRNNAFLEALTEELHAAGIAEVIVCFDNEDKSHKPDPWTRHEAEVYQLYACHALRAKGFITHHVMLPDEWRIDGKADWDGALSKFGNGAKARFEDVLKAAKRYYIQLQLFGLNEKQRIIQCKLNRLIADPKILSGGEEEEELARLILKTPHPWRQALSATELAQELFETRGCYYVRKKKAYKDLKEEYNYKEILEKQIHENGDSNPEERAKLDAALAAVQHLIDGRPEILSDFTIECEFMLRTTDDKVERLMRFTNKHGERSRIVAVPSSESATSSRFREFCRSVGNFNLIMGDRFLQQLDIDIGALSAWREIRELEMLGQDRESGLWIFGDCAFTKDGDVLFADHHDVIWHDGIGYRIDPASLREFAHRIAPQFFQKIGMEPCDVLAEIKADPDKEEREVAAIFFQLSADFICTFGDATGLLVFGVVLAYAMAPEVLKKYHGHPGLWIHGLLQAGKTETAAFLMQLWGYMADYRNASLSAGTTNVGIDRWLAQYSNILMHLDEFRQREADASRIASLRMPFNRQAKGKGRMDQTNKTRSVEPATSPMVTGEGVTGDSATLSRYVEAILAVDKRIGTKAQQIARYNRMKLQSGQYHRIIRWILMNRKWYAGEGIRLMDEFTTSEDSTGISERLRITYGAAYSGYMTLFTRFASSPNAATGITKLETNDQWLVNACVRGILPKKDGKPITSLPDKELFKAMLAGKPLLEFTADYARKAAADVISINFTVKFWTDVLDLYQREPGKMKHFIAFERCQIDEDTNRVDVLATKHDGPGTVRCVIVNWQPLYSEVAKDLRQQGKEPDLPLPSLRKQTSTERYYVPGPKHTKNGSHRMTIDKQQVTVTILRCDRMDSALEAVFSDRFEESEQEELSI